MSSPLQVLVVEDDVAIRRGVRDALRHAGYRPLEAGDGATALRTLRGQACDLVLLDMILPDMNGIEVLRSARALVPNLPVIFMTACGSEPDRVGGLREGADDYVVKPFSVMELLARVEAVLRRATAPSAPNARQWCVGPLTLDSDTLRLIDPASNDGVNLSQRECDVLAFLSSAGGQTVSRDELLRSVWQLDPRGLRTRTVDVHVARVREKLAALTDGVAIETVHGRGYRLVNADAAEPNR